MKTPKVVKIDGKEWPTIMFDDLHEVAVIRLPYSMGKNYNDEAITAAMLNMVASFLAVVDRDV